MQSHKTQYFCLKCHIIGDIDQFELQVLSQGCFKLICRSCEGKSAVFTCSGCGKNNFLQIEVIEQSKIFTCNCQISYRVLQCAKCNEYSQFAKKGSLLQGATLSCSNCKCNQVKLNCPSCQYGQECIYNQPNPNQFCNCYNCGVFYRYDECPDEKCLGELFTINKDKSQCTLNKEHTYFSYQCLNVACKTQCYMNKNDKDTLINCKTCTSAFIKSNCLGCHEMMIIQHPNDGMNQGFQQSQCTNCLEKQSQIQCPGCLIGIMQISQSWFDYVRKQKSINPTPFTPIKCDTCKIERTFVLCRHCENMTMFRPDQLLGNCQKCDKAYEIKKAFDKSIVYCIACQTEECAYVLSDCGHACYCKACLEVMLGLDRKCPMCKMNVTKYQRIYFA